MARVPALVDLAAVAERRADLDTAERRLIETARAEGATWAQVARALGLRSRQAAEQRWLRLTGDTSSGRNPAAVRASRRQGQVLGTVVSSGRETQQILDLARVLDVALASGPEGSRRGASHGAMRLAAATLGLAADAPAGPRHDLARQALGDLRPIPADVLGLDASRAADILQDVLESLRDGGP